MIRGQEAEQAAVVIMMGMEEETILEGRERQRQILVAHQSQNRRVVPKPRQDKQGGPEMEEDPQMGQMTEPVTDLEMVVTREAVYLRAIVELVTDPDLGLGEVMVAERHLHQAGETQMVGVVGVMIATTAKADRRGDRQTAGATGCWHSQGYLRKTSGLSRVEWRHCCVRCGSCLQ